MSKTFFDDPKDDTSTDESENADAFLEERLGEVDEGGHNEVSREDLDQALFDDWF